MIGDADAFVRGLAGAHPFCQHDVAQQDFAIVRSMVFLGSVLYILGLLPEVIACHYISGNGTVELQVVAADLAGFSRFALQRLIHLPNVKDLHTSFSLGEVKAASALPLAHLFTKSLGTASKSKT